MSGMEPFDTESASYKEERPTGPLNVDPAFGGTPADDVTTGESEEFVDGFTWRVFFGILFIGLIMMPGAIYLSLVAGQGLGPAAEWVTVILFLEVARRSYQTLTKQEIYMLVYVGASLTSAVAGVGLAGGVFAAFIWNQYIINSPFSKAYGITAGAPLWASPKDDSPALIQRTFIHHDWLPAIGLMIFFQIFGRMTSWGLGYALFRITSDIERLPFPLAPISAEGATALAESSSQKEGWRWRLFSIGAMIGVGWGFLYVLIPSVTGIIFAQPIVIVTNPFIDLTPNTQKLLPAALSAIGTDLGSVLVGFVLPLPVVIGTFVTSIGCHIVANPFLQHAHILKQWTSGMDVTLTQVSNNFDFWLSFGIGTAIVVAIIGICSVVKALYNNSRGGRDNSAPRIHPPRGRGDVPIPYAMGAWAVGTFAYIGMCHYLVPEFPVWILFFFGFIWTPIFSYISARMAGLAGSGVSIPFVKEATVMMVGYSKVDIWFAPIPLSDYGGMATQFRIVELTKTKFISVVKAEVAMLPVMLVCSFLFWSVIWRLSPIPASSYPYAAKFWPVAAQTQALMWTANRKGASNLLLHVINTHYIALGSGLATVTYFAVVALQQPIMLFYGLVSGVQTMPYSAIPLMLGALLGRFYFQKRYGVENWRAYAPVLVAGYYCGTGLIGLASVALDLLSKSVSRLPY